MQPDRLGHGLMPRELAAVVVGDGAAGRGGQPAQFGGDGLGGEVGVFALKTPGQGQPGAPLLQGQEDVALAAEVHQVALPVAELAAQMRLCRPLLDRRPVGDGGLAASVATPPARFGLRCASSRGRPARRPAGL